MYTRESANYVRGFYFVLSFNSIDAAFQEVSGITKEMALEEVVCGGENRFKYRLPTVATSPNLVLKRALVPVGSKLISWCANTIDSGLANTILPQDVSLSLLGEDGSIKVKWTFAGAYPVKFSVADLKSDESHLAIESIELAYSYFEITKDLSVSGLFS